MFAFKGVLIARFQTEIKETGAKVNNLQFMTTDDKGKMAIVAIKDEGSKFANAEVNKEITVSPVSISQYNGQLFYKVIAK